MDYFEVIHHKTDVTRMESFICFSQKKKNLVKKHT